MRFVLTVKPIGQPKETTAVKNFATLDEARKELIVEITSSITDFGDDVRNHTETLKKATTIEVGHTIKCMFWLFFITFEDF